MEKVEVAMLAIEHGWSPDSYGHLKKTIEDGVWTLRLKLGKRVVRLEKQWRIQGETNWRRLRSEFYGKLTEEKLLAWRYFV